MLGAATKDSNGAIRPTAAGLFMFGNEYQIVREYPEYFLDYREYDSTSAIDWIDRVYSTTGTWSGNICDFYFRVIEKLYKWIKVPFKLEMKDGIMTRVDETPIHIAVREAFVNCIINADFYIPSGIVILSKFEMLQGGISDARNKALMKMFNLLGIGERAGSGVPRIFTVWKEEELKEPEIDENFKFVRTTLTLSLEKKKASGKASHAPTQYKSEIQNEELITKFLNDTGESTTKEIAIILNLSPQRTRVILNRLCQKKIIIALGSDRNRKYKLS